VLRKERQDFSFRNRRQHHRSNVSDCPSRLHFPLLVGCMSKDQPAPRPQKLKHLQIYVSRVPIQLSDIQSIRYCYFCEGGSGADQGNGCLSHVRKGRVRTPMCVSFNLSRTIFIYIYSGICCSPTVILCAFLSSSILHLSPDFLRSHEFLHLPQSLHSRLLPFGRRRQSHTRRPDPDPDPEPPK
jgi:hypothetical protein